MRSIEDGRLKMTDSDAHDVWQTENAEGAMEEMLLNIGTWFSYSTKGRTLGKVSIFQLIHGL
uniref:Uncharacterized protein n=1 Tax=Nelumbo nucifera TaxID=4432 RepID=A0A822ZLB2_NELNU|nr:TPA_asm: hypothetical protein HUJ06_001996 [Nelumbo nucifera]